MVAAAEKRRPAADSSDGDACLAAPTAAAAAAAPPPAAAGGGGGGDGAFALLRRGRRTQNFLPGGEYGLVGVTKDAFVVAIDLLVAGLTSPPPFFVAQLEVRVRWRRGRFVGEAASTRPVWCRRWTAGARRQGGQTGLAKSDASPSRECPECFACGRRWFATTSCRRSSQTWCPTALILRSVIDLCFRFRVPDDKNLIADFEDRGLLIGWVAGTIVYQQFRIHPFRTRHLNYRLRSSDLRVGGHRTSVGGVSFEHRIALLLTARSVESCIAQRAQLAVTP